MQARIENPAITVPGAMGRCRSSVPPPTQPAFPATTLYLIETRASQINGCSVCLDMHSRELKAEGEPDERVFMVGAWREAPYFSDAERAALALTEAVTRLADRSDPVPDEVWEEAARHYDESAARRRWSSRSRRSTPGTASTRPPGRSQETGSSSGSSGRPSRLPDRDPLHVVRY